MTVPPLQVRIQDDYQVLDTTETDGGSELDDEDLQDFFPEDVVGNRDFIFSVNAGDMEIEEPKLSAVTLRFTDKEIEREFDDLTHQNLLRFSTAFMLVCLFSFILALGVLFLDQSDQVQAGHRTVVAILWFSLSFLCLLLFLLFHFFERQIKRRVELILVPAIVAIIGILSVAHLIPATAHTHPIALSVLLLGMIVVMRPPFAICLFYLFLASIEYVCLVFAFLGPDKDQRWQGIRLFARILEVTMMAVIAVARLYSIEHFFRKTHIARRALSHQQEVLNAEVNRGQNLLVNVLPRDIVRVIQQDRVPLWAFSKHFQVATVLQSDIVGFTKYSSSREATSVVALVDCMFSRFDALATTIEVEKIKTIGDAYLCAAGVPTSDSQHAEKVALMGLEMILAVDALNREKAKSSPEYENIQIRIGMATGPLTAGVVGIQKLCYDLYGPTVHEAELMESTSKPGFLQCTARTAAALNGYDILREGPKCFVIAAKGTIQGRRVGKGFGGGPRRASARWKSVARGVISNGRFTKIAAASAAARNTVQDHHISPGSKSPRIISQSMFMQTAPPLARPTSINGVVLDSPTLLPPAASTTMVPDTKSAYATKQRQGSTHRGPDYLLDIPIPISASDPRAPVPHRPLPVSHHTVLPSPFVPPAPSLPPILPTPPLDTTPDPPLNPSDSPLNPSKPDSPLNLSKPDPPLVGTPPISPLDPLMAQIQSFRFGDSVTSNAMETSPMEETVDLGSKGGTRNRTVVVAGPSDKAPPTSTITAEYSLMAAEEEYVVAWRTMWEEFSGKTAPLWLTFPDPVIEDEFAHHLIELGQVDVVPVALLNCLNFCSYALLVSVLFPSYADQWLLIVLYVYAGISIGAFVLALAMNVVQPWLHGKGHSHGAPKEHDCPPGNNKVQVLSGHSMITTGFAEHLRDDHSAPPPSLWRQPWYTYFVVSIAVGVVTTVAAPLHIAETETPTIIMFPATFVVMTAVLNYWVKWRLKVLVVVLYVIMLVVSFCMTDKSSITTDAVAIITAFVLSLVSAYSHEKSIRENFVSSMKSEASRSMVVSQLKTNNHLLLQVLPPSILARLVRDPTATIVDCVDNVSLLFVYFDGLDSMNSLDAVEALRELNDFMEFMDRLCMKFQVVKIKTNPFMVVSGCPEPVADHALEIVRLAIALVAAAEAHRGTSPSMLGLQIKIGVHTGSVCAGVVGKSKFIYDCFGDTVNQASRLTTAAPWSAIQVSDAVMQLTKHAVNYIDRGKIALKGIPEPVQAYIVSEGELAEDRAAAQQKRRAIQRRMSMQQRRTSFDPNSPSMAGRRRSLSRANSTRRITSAPFAADGGSDGNSNSGEALGNQSCDWGQPGGSPKSPKSPKSIESVHKVLAELQGASPLPPEPDLADAGVSSRPQSHRSHASVPLRHIIIDGQLLLEQRTPSAGSLVGHPAVATPPGVVQQSNFGPVTLDSTEDA